MALTAEAIDSLLENAPAGDPQVKLPTAEALGPLHPEGKPALGEIKHRSHPVVTQIR